jgi:hypothetical protein
MTLIHLFQIFSKNFHLRTNSVAIEIKETFEVKAKVEDSKTLHWLDRKEQYDWHYSCKQLNPLHLNSIRNKMNCEKEHKIHYSN